MFNTKKEWVKQQRIKEIEALDNGYSLDEIQEAYKVARVMGVSYISAYTLKRGREELKKHGKQTKNN